MGKTLNNPNIKYMEPSGHSKFKITSGCLFHRFCLHQVSSGGFLDTWAYPDVNKKSDVKWYLQGGRGGSWERKRRTNNTLSLLFEPVPGMPVLSQGLGGKVPRVQHSLQGHSDWVHPSLCLYISTQAGAPARMSALPLHTSDQFHPKWSIL